MKAKRNYSFRLGIVFICVVLITVFITASIKQSASFFDRKRLNNGIAVEAPDNWRWVRDGIHLRDFFLLAGEPEKNNAKVLMSGALGIVTYKSNIEGAHHEFLFDKNGFLRFSKWYINLKDDPKIKSPDTIIQNNLKISYPRMVPISWKGTSENGYEVQVDIKIPNGPWTLSKKYYTSQNRMVHQHTGANAGRWRVRALSNKGGGAWSDFVVFTCVN